MLPAAAPSATASGQATTPSGRGCAKSPKIRSRHSAWCRARWKHNFPVQRDRARRHRLHRGKRQARQIPHRRQCVLPWWERISICSWLFWLGQGGCPFVGNYVLSPPDDSAPFRLSLFSCQKWSWVDKGFFCAAKLVNFSKTPEHSSVADIFLRHIYLFLRQADDTCLKMQEKYNSNECKTDPCRSSAQGIRIFCHAFQEKQHQPLNNH